MEQYKQEYNNLLERYHNGCKYIKENPKDVDKYMNKLLEILDQINSMVIKYNITDREIHLKGFKE